MIINLWQHTKIFHKNYSVVPKVRYTVNITRQVSHYMNKWIIFIIIVAAVSAIGVGTRLVTNQSSPEDTLGSVEGGEKKQQKSNPDIRLSNISEYSISPGVLVLHDNRFSMNFLGTQVSGEYETLAEIGDPTAVIAAIKSSPGVLEVLEVPAINPGSTQDVVSTPLHMTDYYKTFNERERISHGGIFVSYMAMIIETNDGVVWLNSQPFYNPRNDSVIKEIGVLTEILDMGTEKNMSIGSGFAGGQPDPTRGDENSNNGTATSEIVQHHPQFYEDATMSDEVVQIDINR